jgi:hypothetical protein
MINLKSIAVALAFGMAVAAAVSPASAAQRSYHPGHDARAQSIPGQPGIANPDGMNGARAKAIQECLGASGKFNQHTWGNTPIQLYRSCMAGHGEVE